MALGWLTEILSSCLERGAILPNTDGHDSDDWEDFVQGVYGMVPIWRRGVDSGCLEMAIGMESFCLRQGVMQRERL